MADMNFDGFEAEDYGSYSSSGRRQRLVHLAGALVSFGLIAGAGVWAYQLAVRDVSGVPVVRALTEPMRIPPVNPGGDEADYQGLSVNSVAAAGLAAPAPDRMVLAPRPVDLTLDDGPGLSATAPQVAAASAQLSSDAARPAAIALADQMIAPTTAPSGPETLVEAALSEALNEIATDTAPDPTPTEMPLVAVASDPALAGMRPRPRPTAGLIPADATATDVFAAPATAVNDAEEMDPASIPVGTRLVQLGAFDDVEGARAEWIRLAGLFAPEFAGKARVVQEAQTGGRSFIRLRAHGFEDEDSARAFCTALLAKSAVCIPVSVQ
jgi:hypothetical protein